MNATSNTNHSPQTSMIRQTFQQPQTDDLPAGGHVPDGSLETMATASPLKGHVQDRPACLSVASEPVWFPWNLECPRILLSSKVAARRRLKAFTAQPPGKGGADTAQALAETLEFFRSHPQCGFSYLVDSLSPAPLSVRQQRTLTFHGLASEEFFRRPASRRLLVSRDRRTCCRISKDGSLVLEHVAAGLDLAAGYARIQDILSILERDMLLAEDDAPDHQQSSQEPTASVLLNIPGILLTKNYGECLDRAAQTMGLRLSFPDWTDHGVHTCLTQLAAQGMADCPSATDCGRLEKTARSIQIHEMDARRELRQTLWFKDRASRARALVTNAYLMTATELVDHLGFLWLEEETLGQPRLPKGFFPFYTRCLSALKPPHTQLEDWGEAPAEEQRRRLAVDARLLFSDTASQTIRQKGDCWITPVGDRPVAGEVNLLQYPFGHHFARKDSAAGKTAYSRSTSPPRSPTRKH